MTRNAAVGRLTEADCRLEDLLEVLAARTDPADYPHADAVVDEVLVYDSARLRRSPRPRCPPSWSGRCPTGPASWCSAAPSPTARWSTGPPRRSSELIAEQRASGAVAGDHFAPPGANDRVWNALEKLAVAAPEVFVDYYANDILALVATAWLGPGYQVTSQLNVVNPGRQGAGRPPRLPPGLPVQRRRSSSTRRTCTGCPPCSPCRARWRTRTCRWRAARRCTCRTRRSTSPATWPPTGPSLATRPPAEQFGDGFLMKQGFTLLWVGWQFDPPQRPGLVRVYPPTATDNGRPIRGLVRSDFVVTERELDHSLADRDHVAYAVVDPELAGQRDDGARLGRRTAARRPARSVGVRARRRRQGRSPIATRVYMAAKFEPGKIYEVVYTAQNPPIVGLGPAAIRDVDLDAEVQVGGRRGRFRPARSSARSRSASRRAAASSAPTCTTGSIATRRNRKVFDGVIAHVAGARPRQLQSPLRAAVAGRPSVPQLLLSDRHLSVHRRRAEAIPRPASTDGLLTHAGRARAAAEDLLHELGIRVLGPRRVAHSHDGRRQAPTRR